MATAPRTQTKITEYCFGRFRLVPMTRELWKDGRLTHASPLVFDCLVYLAQHAERMVGRDELVSAVWGKVDVADSQVRQLLTRARRAVDDDAAAQQVIRTVSGGGYRWVMRLEAPPSEILPVGPAEIAAPTATSELAADPGIDFPSQPEAAVPAVTAESGHGTHAAVRKRVARGAIAAIAIATVVLLLLMLTILFHARPGTLRAPTVPAATKPQVALAVLPLDVDAPSASSWVHLGAMDLISNRLRSAGLSVSPSESVVAAGLAATEPVGAARLEKLRGTLGVSSLVQGAAIKSSAGWTVKLNAVTADGLRHTAEAERPDMTDAAQQAADLLLASLGHATAPDAGEKPDDLQDLLQRAQAALLSHQFDTARAILRSAPDAQRSDPRIRLKLAQVEQRDGKIDQAGATLRALLEDPIVMGHPMMRAEVLTSLGYIAMNRSDCVDAERQFDAALAALPDPRSGLAAGAALSARGGARACLQQVDAAVEDLAAAGPIMEMAGDRLGLARANNHFGLVEVYRHRPADAVPYLRAAADLHESLGAVDELRRDIGLLTLVQTQLLQWPDALATSERLRALTERFDNLSDFAMMAGVRARVLVRMGRYGEAGSLLRAESAKRSDVESSFMLTPHEVKAELAWALGDPHQAITEIEAAWQILPLDKMRDDEDVFTVLLHQRASISAGDPVEAAPPGPPSSNGEEGSGAHVPAYLVARAEWADQRGNSVDAEAEFHAAMTRVESQSVPANTALVADAYARWLLARNRLDDARAVAGRVLTWADRDFDCALLQVAVFHAMRQPDAWSRALRQAQALAGERTIPVELLGAPVPNR